MFENSDNITPLNEEVFNEWLEKGRKARLGYHYLIVLWDEYDSAYRPVYLMNREEIAGYNQSSHREKLIAAYDLYSESRVL